MCNCFSFACSTSGRPVSHQQQFFFFLLNNIQWNHWFFLVTKKLVSHFYYLAGWHTVVTQQQPAHWPLTSPEASKREVQMSWTSSSGCVQSYIYTALHIWLHEADNECQYGWKSRHSHNTDANAFLFSPGTGVTHIVLVGVHSLLLKNSTSHVVKCCLPFRITAACSVCSVIKHPNSRATQVTTQCAKMYDL